MEQKEIRESTSVHSEGISDPDPDKVQSAVSTLAQETGMKTISTMDLSQLQELSIKERQKIQDFISPAALEEAKDWVEFENLTSSEITPEHVKELAEFARYIFSNDWSEYAFCTECDPKNEHGKRLSIQEVFEVKKGEYVSLEDIDDPANLPCCDDCGTKMQHFLDKNATVRTLAKKMEGTTYLTLMRDIKGNVVGSNLGYKADIKTVFNNEWKDVYSYADETTRPPMTRDFENFREKVSDAIRTNDPECGLAPDELISEDLPFVGANLIAVDPRFQGKGHFFALSGNTFMMADPEEYMNCYGACESLPRTRAHKLFLRGGGIEIPGILIDEDVELTEDDYVLVLYKTEGLFRAFCGQ